MKGYETPLFEKLFDEDREILFEKVPKKFLSFKGLKQSIHFSLSNLLNTRKNIFWPTFGDIKIPFQYGVNVQKSWYSENDADLSTLAGKMEEAIRVFEPRILDIKVHIMRLSNNLSSLSATINASVQIGEERIQLSFPVVVET